MTDPRTLGPWLRRFLEEHIVSERNLARNTQLSYRDTLVLLLRFVSRQTRKAADRLTVRDLSAERVRAFLLHLEQERGCLPQTRNQRLAASRAFARYVGSCSPEHVEWCEQIRAIPRKKVAPAAIGYLEKPEIDALLAAPNRATPLGRRDHALLLFLYSTGARVSEAARLTVGDLHPAAAGHPLVTLRGKGGKTRRRRRGLPEPPGTTADALRHAPVGRALRREGPGAGRPAGVPARAAAHRGDASAALGSGPQHGARLAGPRAH